MTTYPVVELFPSIQGEGFFAGCGAVFVRLWGCPNQCPFCDTRYAWAIPRKQTAREFTARRLVEKIRESSIPRVVFTGGEPLLYDFSSLLDLLGDSFAVEIETSGVIPVPACFLEHRWTWVTVSPKPATNWEAHPSWQNRADAWKYLVDETFTPERIDPSIAVAFLQPLAVTEEALSRANLTRTIRYVKESAGRFRLSLQLHKLIHIQ